MAAGRGRGRCQRSTIRKEKMPSGVQSPRKSGVQKDHKSAELAHKKQKKIMRKATKVGPRPP